MTKSSKKNKPRRRLKQLAWVRVTPYVCLSCGNVQLKHVQPGNCDREGCEGDSIVRVGPFNQSASFVIYQDQRKLVEKANKE
ncbi:MAG TPA: hypothetical protein VND65_01840 [Candidatus Binatia bacterium]|nr:hypothetical protein [Candidatus Binatia bacterium]